MIIFLQLLKCAGALGFHLVPVLILLLLHAHVKCLTANRQNVNLTLGASLWF